MKVIALNSGGFDSVVMINTLLNMEDCEVISLFFNWGQPNYEQEKLCAEKIGARCSEHIEVDINMPWVNTDMSENMYIPMRNLVFSSYAVSLAEQRAIKEIYMAIINNGHATPYYDCSPTFYDNLNKLIEGKDIKIETPFIEVNKLDLRPLAKMYGLTYEDFFSCNTPVNGEPCGKCGDCELIKYVIEPNVFERKDFTTEAFKKAYLDTNVEEVRLLINNECQFTCKHCFYGCGEEKKPRLSVEDFKRVIRECYDYLKVNNIHFSGKEPLIDATIFEYTKFIDENFEGKTYDIVTNGATITKYIENLKECKNLHRLFLSVDTLEGETTLRNTNKHIVDNILLVLKSNIDLQVTIDLTKDNAPKLNETILNLISLGVKNIYVRNIKPLGEAIDIQDKILTPQEYGEVLDRLFSLDIPEDVEIEVNIHKDMILESKGTRLEYYVEASGKELAYHPINIAKQNYCYRFLTQVTITPDGYFLGCASEVSVPHYDKLSSGNLQEDDMLECLLRGRLDHLDNYINKSCKKGCTFCN